MEETIYMYDVLKRKEKIEKLMPKVRCYERTLFEISEKYELYVDSAHVLSLFSNKCNSYYQ